MFNSTTSQSLFCYNIFNVLIYYYVVQGIINNSRIKYLSNYIVSFFHNILSFVFYLSIPSLPTISKELDNIYASTYNYNFINKYQNTMFNQLFGNVFPFENNFFREFNKNFYIIAAIHIGYYLGDTIKDIYNKKYLYLFHHVISVYFVLINIRLGYTWILQQSMILAETTAFLLNLRLLALKIHKKIHPVVDWIILIIFFTLRTYGMWEVYIMLNIYDFNFEIKNILAMTVMLYIMSLYWCIQLLVKLTSKNKKNLIQKINID